MGTAIVPESQDANTTSPFLPSKVAPCICPDKPMALTFWEIVFSAMLQHGQSVVATSLLGFLAQTQRSNRRDTDNGDVSSSPAP